MAYDELESMGGDAELMPELVKAEVMDETEAESTFARLVEAIEALEMRTKAKAEKNWALSDEIRDRLTAIGIRVKDRKDGCDWEIE